MSMNGNPHAAQAVSRLRNGTINEVSRAAVEAQLALAHEKRTANLIAILNVGYTSAKVAGVDYAKVADSIKERLGL